jgi:hypothetical protein
MFLDSLFYVSGSTLCGSRFRFSFVVGKDLKVEIFIDLSAVFGSGRDE